jgi:T5SS/PEP-CTERM-associated repeat protein
MAGLIAVYRTMTAAPRRQGQSLIVRIVVAALLMPLARHARAEVLASGDVTPRIFDQELDEYIPNLPIGGGTVNDTIVVGGTGFQVGDTDIGSVLINNPTVTLPLISNNGTIGSEAVGVGTVTITGSGSQWRVKDELIVGDQGIGTLNLQNGGLLADDPPSTFTSYDLEVIVGNQTGSQGFVNLTGSGSLLRSDLLTVGQGGFGQMTVNTQTRVETLSTAIVGNLGDSALDIGTGFVTVTGTGARWTIGNTQGSAANRGILIVGGGGRGALVISAGGEVRVIDPNLDDGDITIGDTATSLGEVTVTGQFSQLWAFGTINISDSQNGRGILYVQNQGVARANEGIVISRNGVLELAGGSVLTPNTSLGVVTNRGVIRTAVGAIGVIQSVVNNEALGEIRTAGTVDRVREKLNFLRAVNNKQGAMITSIGGEMEFAAVVTNDSGGTIAGRDAVYRFSGGLTNNGTLAFSVGASDIFGKVTNNSGGVIGVATKTQATFYDDVVMSGGELSVLPGGAAIFIQDFNLSTTSTVSIHLSKVANVMMQSEINVFGTMSIGSAFLQVYLDGGLVPQPGDSWTIASGTSITGTFNPLFPAAPGNNWRLDYTAQSVILKYVAAPAFSGDFNGDGVVNTLDLQILQGNFGLASGATPAMGDADGDGDVDGQDFVIWQRTIGPVPAVPAVGTVPEPGALGLAAVALACGCWRRRRHAIA